jgi:hypothetical protein
MTRALRTVGRKSYLEEISAVIIFAANLIPIDV